MNVREEIEGLVAIEGRLPGSDAERRAARHLVERLEALGREAETESVDAWPNWALTYAVHALLVIAGSVISVVVPVAGALIVLVVTVLTFLDAIGMAYTTRKLMGRRASQNVISREHDDDKGGDVYLVAHYDAGRDGLAYHGRVQERRASFGKLVRRGIGPMEPYFWAMLVVTVCVLVRLPGIESQLITVVQFIGTALLIVALPFLVDTALSSAVPGANDNASGVATVLRLNERFGGQLEHFRLNLLFTGAQEGGSLGMRSFLRRRRGELEPARTVFVNVDEVGRGTVRFTSQEGLLLTIDSHEQLLDICEGIVAEREQALEQDDDNEDGGDRSEDDRNEDEGNDDDGSDGDGNEDDGDEEQPAVRSMTWRTSSDGYAARSASFPAISVTCKGRLDYTIGHHQATDTADRIDDDALERAFDFTTQLVERVDQKIGPDLAKPADETLLKEES